MDFEMVDILIEYNKIITDIIELYYKGIFE